jgi:UDP-N-acetylglucosamine acyltransferase
MENESIYSGYDRAGNKIDSSAIVHPTVIMGKDNVICEGVIIRAHVSIGNGNYFGPYCIIGDFPEKVGFFDQLGGVVIGDNNRFTKQCTIDSGTAKPTRIHNDVIMLKNAHVGHDAEIGDGVTLSCNVCIGGFTIVGCRTNFGLGSVAHQRVIVAADCMIGMNSTITKKTDTRKARKYVGSPARDIGENNRGN